MNLKIITLILFVLAMHVLPNDALFSSFWAPLYDPRILNYRVDAKFQPEAGKSASYEYEGRYGTRGQRLIDEFGTGRTPSTNRDYIADNGVKFFYTYRKTNGIL